MITLQDFKRACESREMHDDAGRSVTTAQSNHELKGENLKRLTMQRNLGSQEAHNFETVVRRDLENGGFGVDSYMNKKGIWNVLVFFLVLAIIISVLWVGFHVYGEVAVRCAANCTKIEVAT